jgi:hypothetical protein
VHADSGNFGGGEAGVECKLTTVDVNGTFLGGVHIAANDQVGVIQSPAINGGTVVPAGQTRDIVLSCEIDTIGTAIGEAFYDGAQLMVFQTGGFF